MDEIRKFVDGLREIADRIEETDRKYSIIKELSELTGRVTGMTTRLVDKYVQELYNHEGEWVEIIDHYDTPEAHRILLNKVLDRMHNEHPHDNLKVDKTKRIPKLCLVKCKTREFVKGRIDSIIEELKSLE